MLSLDMMLLKLWYRGVLRDRGVGVLGERMDVKEMRRHHQSSSPNESNVGRHVAYEPPHPRVLLLDHMITVALTGGREERRGDNR